MIRSFRKFFEFAGRQSRNWYLGLFYEIIRCILEALQFAALLVVLDGLVRDNITTQTALLAFGIMLVSVIGTIIFWYLAHGKEGEGSYRMCEEPSSNLDIKSIRELKDVLRKWKAQGKTIVIAEHRLYYLMDIADRVLYMQGGQIKENLSISDFKKKSTGELHALGLRTLQSEDFSKMQSTVCATKQLYIRDFEVSYKNASGGKTKKRKVLDISDLMIPQGSVVGVVGNNGAGKTTFANNLCGLLKTAKGCMSMNGKTYMANQRIKTCYMVMQDVNHQLFTESVMDEILLSLDNSDEEKVAHEAESIMESLHISEFRDAHPMSLSGGQKQRVAIASAIASDKQVIVFDEPTSGLDYRHMKKVAENLRELSSLGKTLFIVTHDPELIAECCNYFVFIENGKVLWSDGWNRISRERLQKFFAFEDD